MTYQTEVLADNPAAVWFFDEESGTSIADSSGNSNDGTASGGFTLDQDGPGGGLRAILFNGSTSQIRVPESASLSRDPQGQITYEMWINPLSSGSGDGGNIICNARTGSNINTGFRVRIEDGSDTPRVLTQVGGSTSHFPTFSAPEFEYDDTWYHLVYVFDRTGDNPRLRQYVNGVFTEGEDTADADIGSNSRDDLVIGNGNGISEFFHGRIAAPAVYKSALSPARILAHYEAVAAPAEPPWSLTVNTGGNGSVLVEDDGTPVDPTTHDWDDEDVATLTATPDSGWELADPLWTGQVPSGDVNDNPLSLVMDRDRTVTANFVESDPPPPPPDGAFRRVRFDGQWFPLPEA